MRDMRKLYDDDDGTLSGATNDSAWAGTILRIVDATIGTLVAFLLIGLGMLVW